MLIYILITVEKKSTGEIFAAKMVSGQKIDKAYFRVQVKFLNRWNSVGNFFKMVWVNLSVWIIQERADPKQKSVMLFWESKLIHKMRGKSKFTTDS